MRDFEGPWVGVALFVVIFISAAKRGYIHGLREEVGYYLLFG